MNKLMILYIFLALFVLNGVFSLFLLSKYYILPRYRKYIGLQLRSIRSSNQRSATIPVRKFNAASNEKIRVTELDSTYELQDQKIDLNKTALLIIDAWKDHPNGGWLARMRKNQKTKLLPLLKLARKNHITVIHAPHNQEIADELKPLPNELVLSYYNRLENSSEFDQYLKKYNITTLLCAGYALNWCLLDRQVGMVQMHSMGYSTILVRDATIAFETPESLSEQWAYKMTVNIIESILDGTTTVDELKNNINT